MRAAADDDEKVALARRELALTHALPPSPHLVRALAAVEHPPAPLSALPGGDGGSSGSGGGHGSGGPLYIDFDLLLEYAPCGSAWDEAAAAHARGESVPESVLLARFRDAAAGLAAMHAARPPLVHRDIKPENILLFQGVQGSSGGAGAEGGAPPPRALSLVAKLCDFGSTQVGWTRLESEADCRAADDSLQRTTTPA
jgi:serine/threonine protein kinase